MPHRVASDTSWRNKGYATHGTPPCMAPHRAWHPTTHGTPPRHAWHPTTPRLAPHHATPGTPPRMAPHHAWHPTTPHSVRTHCTTRTWLVPAPAATAYFNTLSSDTGPRGGSNKVAVRSSSVVESVDAGGAEDPTVSTRACGASTGTIACDDAMAQEMQRLLVNWSR